jgi:pimeloyl-ACP methyl ester carboxylesterase
VVVGTNYAGLGVGEDAEGNEIRHPYFSKSAHANDIFYSVEAAHKAWPVLSSRFVTMGHSQGGGAAWACAQRQAERPVEGYLGTIAASPLTQIILQLDYKDSHGIPQYLGLAYFIGHALSATLAGFNISEFLTPAGVDHYDLVTAVQGCNGVTAVLDSEPDLIKPYW